MQETTNENSHKTILKSTGIFGFSQLMKMVIGVVGSKFVALFLGPAGIAIVGLLTNVMNIITSLTSFGISTTAVREVSLAKAKNDRQKFSERILVLQRWSVIIGLFGLIVTILFSKYLSQLTFGKPDHYIWFIALSVNFLLTSLTSYRIALLQGMQMIKQIAISNVVISFLVVLFTVPIYYFLRLDGIIPVILISSSIGLLVNFYFSREIKIDKIKLSFSDTISKGKPLMKLGFLLSVNVIFGQICTYIIKLYLNGSGTTSEILGFYEVSTVILLSYVGLIFNAMSTDFYPRLTSIQNDNRKVKELANNQMEIALLIVTPAILTLYFIAPIFIRILYSKAFLGVLFIFKAALFAIIIKAIIWPLGYIILAKGNRNQFFKQELLGDAMNIVFTILFYHLFGLVGIGIAMVLHYTIYGFYVYAVVKKEYNFSFTSVTFSLLLKSTFLGFLASLTVFFVDYPIAYFPLGILVIISIFFSYKELDKRVDINAFLIKIKSKFKKQ